MAPNGASIRCKVPPGSSPGSTIFVELPASATPIRASQSSAPRQITVKIPQNVKPGDEMEAIAPDGTRFTFRVPINAVPDTTIRVVINSDDSSASRPQKSVNELVQDTGDDASTPNFRSANGTTQEQTRSSPPISMAMEPSVSLSPPRLMEPAQDLSSSSTASLTRII